VSSPAMLDLAWADPSATYVSFYSVGGEYTESLPHQRRTRAAHLARLRSRRIHAANSRHGFPVRLVCLRLYGYKSAKYLCVYEVTDHAITGYWEQYGYSYMPRFQRRSCGRASTETRVLGTGHRQMKQSQMRTVRRPKAQLIEPCSRLIRYLKSTE